jgi:hypothetical protein
LNVTVMVVVIAAAVAFGVALMFVVRRRMRSEYLIANPEPLSGIFGVVGTAFAVLLAFVVLVAFQSYADGRGGAEDEAGAVVEMFRTGRFFPPAQQSKLQGELACYSRSVVHDEWPAMRHRNRGALVDDWIVRMRSTIEDLDVETPKQQAAFEHLLEERDERAAGRRDRFAEAEPVVPGPVWFILVLGGAITIFGVALFADRRERFLVQGGPMAMVSALVASSLLLVWFLDHPYENKNGSIKPVEMRRSLEMMHHEQPEVSPPCDVHGRPRPV